MAYSEDHIALAAEYALGTLDRDERAQVETLMAADEGYAALVQAWEFRLSVLNQMVGLVEPRPVVWDRIKAAIAASQAQAELAAVPPQARTQDVTTQEDAPHDAALQDAASVDSASPVQDEPSPASPEAATAIGEEAADQTPGADGSPAVLTAEPVAQAVNDNADAVRLASKVRQWRMVANAMTAVAAVLLAMLAVQVYRPDLLPDGLRPKRRTPLSAQYVALLQKDGSSPAFILTVDAGSKNFTVRRVGAAPEPGKSYELWLVSDKLQRPRSLGVIGGNDFTTRPALAAYDPDTVNRATYAVTIEPEGGSPTGVATGPIVFSGKLIETVPPPAR